MKKVLTRTFLFTLVALAIAGIVYSCVSRRIYVEGVEIITVLALCAAIPIILGYIISELSLRSSSSILIGIKIILFLVNGGLLIGGLFLTIGFGLEIPVAFIGTPFLLAGSYTYYETIKLIRKAPNPQTQALSESDVLDDFFIDNK